MSSKTIWFSFGDLKVGEKFVFHNPYCGSPVVTSETLVKISPRKYRVEHGPDAGREWQTSVRSAVALVSRRAI